LALNSFNSTNLIPNFGYFIIGTSIHVGSGYLTAVSDPQLDALLRLKAAMDGKGVLQGWNRGAGANAGYCYVDWVGVYCAKGTSTVYSINLWPGTGVQGLKGTLPPAAAFTGLEGLTQIAIGDQPGLTGTLPADWSRLTQLTEIMLNNNSLSGSIAPSWGSFKSLYHLALWMNNLSGRLPDSFKALAALQYFGVAGNKITGTLPAWLGGLHNLQTFAVDSNKMSGTIPASLGGLQRLRELWLKYNQFTGTLPDALKELTSLELLVMQGTALAGSVPRSWSAMKKLKSVYMYDNPQLRGCLPATWKQQLADFDVEANVFSGTNIHGFCNS
jgi:hypothetical protein